MNKILVFCSDVLPLKGMATSGGGLRSWQIIQGLLAHGFDVAYSMPEECYLSRTFRDQIPEDARASLWNIWNQEQIIEREKPDVIVLTKPALKHWKKKYDIPLAVDFHGPDVIEAEQMVKRTEPTVRDLVRHNRAISKLQTIAEADFFTCAGRRQRYYFMAFLLMAGVGLDDIDVHYMPVAMSSDPPLHRSDTDRRSIIFAGGFYPWLNPMPALRDLADCLTEVNGLHLEIFGGSHETNPEEKKEFDKFRQEMQKNPAVTFHGTIPRDKLLDW